MVYNDKKSDTGRERPDEKDEENRKVSGNLQCSVVGIVRITIDQYLYRQCFHGRRRSLEGTLRQADG